MKQPIYQVTFVHDYATISTTVAPDYETDFNDDDLISMANAIIFDEYGIEPLMIGYNDILVEQGN